MHLGYESKWNIEDALFKEEEGKGEGKVSQQD